MWQTDEQCRSYPRNILTSHQRLVLAVLHTPHNHYKRVFQSQLSQLPIVKSDPLLVGSVILAHSLCKYGVV